MRSSNRRGFLAKSVATTALPLFPNLAFLSQVSRASAADTQIDPQKLQLTSSMEELVKRIQTTPRNECVAVFIDLLQNGLSYQDFLSALLLATIEHGDPHQVAGVYSAHRISSEARVEERLLPLFWALDRITAGYQEDRDARPPGPLTGELPAAGDAAAVFRDAMKNQDHAAAERAIVVIARCHGARYAMSLLWEPGSRRITRTFGHHPIMIANAWRTLEALAWQNPETALRWLVRYFAKYDSDRTYEPNQERARKTLAALPADWAIDEPNRGSTLELYQILRDGATDDACDLACTQLSSGRVKAGAVWDAIHLVAADLLFRYRRGGSPIGNSMIHAVTSTNASRCGFNCSGDDRVRLFLLLQSIGGLSDLFVQSNQKDKELRDINLLDLKEDDTDPTVGIAQVFCMLPNKTRDPAAEEAAAYRKASDDACRTSFSLLKTPANQVDFIRIARGLLCAKATANPHDLKYPVAEFEDVALASPEWRPYLLAASVHALHGTASADSPVLLQARLALT